MLSPTALVLLTAGAPAAYATAVSTWLALAHRRYREVTGQPGPPPRIHAAEVRRKWALRRWQLRGALPSPALPGPPVLLVHGFVARASHFRGLQHALHARGRATRAVDLGWPLRGVDTYTPNLVQALEAAPRVDVVAHSMGGIVLRAALRDRPDLRGRVRTVVTLGSPHHGTEAARGLPPGLPRDLADLAPDSPYLQALPPLADLLPDAARHAVAARYDVVVFPTERAFPAGMQSHLLPHLGHNGLLTEPEVHRLIAALLQAGSSRDG